MPNKQSSVVKKKRKWNGAIANKKNIGDLSVLGTCSSQRKLNMNNEMSASIVKNPLDNDYFMLVHFAMLQNIFCELMCPNCGSNIILYDENLKRRGYSHFISVKCSNCDWIKASYTSPETKPKEIKKIQGRRAFDINVRAVAAFREIGCGFNAMDTFSSVMNL